MLHEINFHWRISMSVNTFPLEVFDFGVSLSAILCIIMIWSTSRAPNWSGDMGIVWRWGERQSHKKVRHWLGFFMIPLSTVIVIMSGYIFTYLNIFLKIPALQIFTNFPRTFSILHIVPWFSSNKSSQVCESISDSNRLDQTCKYNKWLD